MAKSKATPAPTETVDLTQAFDIRLGLFALQQGTMQQEKMKRHYIAPADEQAAPEENPE
jgi:hypothetical protein